MTKWLPGYTRTELEVAQERYGVRFPPDLVGYDWSSENDALRRMLGWPSEILAFDVDHGAWWTAWGERPTDPAARREVVRDALARAPPDPGLHSPLHSRDAPRGR